MSDEEKGAVRHSAKRDTAVIAVLGLVGIPSLIAVMSAIGGDAPFRPRAVKLIAIGVTAWLIYIPVYYAKHPRGGLDV